MKLLWLAMTLAVAAAQTPQNKPAATGTVSGVVRRTDTSTPVEGVKVHLNRTDDYLDIDNFFLDQKPPIVGTANEDGIFSIKGLAPGKYSVWIENIQGFFWEDSPDVPGGLSVVITPEHPTDDIVIRLSPLGSISGRVLNVDGRPLVGAEVKAACRIYRHGVPNLERCGGASRVTTDLEGHYRVFWLQPGTYYVQTEYHPSMEYSPPTVYFPGTLEQSQAVSISINAGSELTGIDFSLVAPTAAASFTVSGKIAGLPPALADKPVSAIHLTSHDKTAERKELRFTNAAGDKSNGQFHIRGVPAGMYELWTTVRDDNGLNYTADAFVEVSVSNIENVIAGVLPVFDIHGRILIGGKPPENPFGKAEGPPRVVAVDETPAEWPINSRNDIQFDKSSGEFTISRVPAGRYRLDYYPPSAVRSGYVEDVRQGGRSILSGFKVDKDSNPPIEILINSSGGTIEGVAIGSNLNPHSGARIVILPTADTRTPFDWNYSLSSDKEGHFSLSRLAPGEYKVYAWEKLPEGDPWRNAEFMRPFELQAVTIVVSAGKTTSVRVPTLPGVEK